MARRFNRDLFSIRAKRMITKVILTAGVLYGCFLLILLAIAMGIFGIVPLAFAAWVAVKFFTHAWADGGKKKKPDKDSVAFDTEKESELEQLEALHKAGMYTREEYEAAKKKIMEERFI